MFKGQVIVLEYPVNPAPRYGYGKPPHPELSKIFQRSESIYEYNLTRFMEFEEEFINIPLVSNQMGSTEPAWINGWLPGLDSISIYGHLAQFNPQKYFEIGSGNSTKFARQAINKHKLKTQITSFDPVPRAEIDHICDKIVRNPVEEVDLTVFSELQSNDVLFIDNSHRSFTNSDVTVVFLEILPRLNPGVIVGFHDILLPFDYPPDWKNRFYNEQYLLACYILAEGNKFEIILPNYYVSKHYRLSKILSPLWENPALKGVEPFGSSFWIKIK